MLVNLRCVPKHVSESTQGIIITKAISKIKTDHCQLNFPNISLVADNYYKQLLL